MRLLRRIFNLFRQRQVSAETEEELRAHLELAAEEAMAAGMSEAEARRAARLRFGNPLVLRERTAGVEVALGLSRLWLDWKIALRHLRKSPGFAITAVLTLALGIGAITAIFTLVQQVMLRSLPVAEPKQLLRIGDSAGCCFSAGYKQSNEGVQNDWSFFSWEAYKLFRAQTPQFRDLAAFQIGEGNAELAVRPAGSRSLLQARNGEYVSGNFFRTLGIAAWRGRLFTDADDEERASPVAVMSFHCWQEQYGSDPSVVGGEYEINGHLFRVIGVTPPGFYGAKVVASGMPDLWIPLTKEPLIAGATSRLKNPALAWLDIIGRVRPRADVQALQAQLRGELHEWLASHVPDMDAQERAVLSKQTLTLSPGGAGVSLMQGDYGYGLRLLLTAACSVLLLACVNLANLLLARGLRNRQQTAIHVALGSPRGRLVRKAVMEGVTLAILGCAAGAGIAWMGAQLVLHLAFPRSAQTGWIPVQASPSLSVLLFALGISAFTGVAFALIPAWITSDADPVDAMRGAKHSVGGSQQKGPKILVIAQGAISLVLLSVAGMFGQSLRNLEHQDFGFDPGGRYLISIDPKLSNIPLNRLPGLFRDMETDLRALPGVRSAGSVLEAPPGGWLTHEIRIEGEPEPVPTADFVSGWTRVTPGFFSVFQDRIVMGRPITNEDTAATQPVAVVNRAFAKKFFGGRNPIGQHFGPAPERNAGMYEIVGVASNLTFEGRLQKAMYFLPEAQSTEFGDANTQGREVWSHYLYNIVIWAPGDPPQLETRVKKVLAEVDPDLMVFGMNSYAQVIRDGFAQEKMIASLASLFGILAVILAAVGLYGLTAYGAEQRTSEIGLRMALGSSRIAVLNLILRGALLQVGIGVAIGIPLAIGAGDLIASRLFGVSPWNPSILGLAALIIVMAALLAAMIPARRAAGIDPVQALRAE